MTQAATHQLVINKSTHKKAISLADKVRMDVDSLYMSIIRDGLDSFFDKRQKLSDPEVKEIRLLYKKGGYTQRQLGLKFGVTTEQVNRIIKLKSRANV